MVGQSPRVLVNGNITSSFPYFHSSSNTTISLLHPWEKSLHFPLTGVTLIIKHYKSCIDFNIKLNLIKSTTGGLCGAFNQPLTSNNSSFILSPLASVFDYHQYGESCM